MSILPERRPIAIIIGGGKGGKPKGDPTKPSDPRARKRIFETEFKAMQEEIKQLKRRVSDLEAIVNNV